MSRLSLVPAGRSQTASTAACGSANRIHNAPPDARIQDTRRQVVVLQTLWSKVCPLRDAKEKKYERLRWLAQQTGRIVDSANELTAAELECCIQVLLRQARDLRHSREGAPPNVLSFPNRNGITREQRWKVSQLECYFGWHNSPERLAGLLRSKFKDSGGNLEHLNHAQAWRLIEMLFAIAARTEAKRGREPGYKVPAAELRAARTALKERLQTWRPDEDKTG